MFVKYSGTHQSISRGKEKQYSTVLAGTQYTDGKPRILTYSARAPGMLTRAVAAPGNLM